MVDSNKDETTRIRKEMTGGMEMSPPSWVFSIFKPDNYKTFATKIDENPHQNKKTL